jgi:membrane protease YdiL (CAAX protease family)
MPDAATIGVLRDVVFLIALAVGFGAVGFKLVRRVAPLAGWNYGGNVLTRLYDLPDAVLALLLAWLLTQGLFAEAGNATPVSLPQSHEPAGQQLGSLLMQILFSLVMSVGLVSYLRFYRRLDPAELFGVRNLPLRKVVIFALAAIAPTLVLVGIVNASVSEALQNVWPDASPQEIVKTFETTGSFAVRVVMMFAAVVIAPLSEELLFRGFFYGVCKRYTDMHFAAIINALLFATVHLHVASFMPLFALALVLVAVYEITGSLLVPMLMHAMFNGIMIIAMLVGGE